MDIEEIQYQTIKEIQDAKQITDDIELIRFYSTGETRKAAQLKKLVEKTVLGAKIVSDKVMEMGKNMVEMDKKDSQDMKDIIKQGVEHATKK